MRGRDTSRGGEVGDLLRPSDGCVLTLRMPGPCGVTAGCPGLVVRAQGAFQSWQEVLPGGRAV